MADKEKAQYAPPASQVDLEERLANDNKSFKVLSTSDQYEAPADDEAGRTYLVEGNETEGYVGVSGEYATYANETEAPLKGDDSADNKVIESFGEQMAQLESEGRIGGEETEAAAESTSTTESTTTRTAKKSTSSDSSS